MRWLKALFAWCEVRNTGVWSYQVNVVTGRRRIVQTGAGGWQPRDEGWLATGEWSRFGLSALGRFSLRRNAE